MGVLLILNDFTGSEVLLFLESPEKVPELDDGISDELSDLVGHHRSIGVEEQFGLAFVFVHLSQFLGVNIQALLVPVIGQESFYLVNSVGLLPDKTHDVHRLVFFGRQV